LLLAPLLLSGGQECGAVTTNDPVDDVVSGAEQIIHFPPFSGQSLLA